MRPRSGVLLASAVLLAGVAPGQTQDDVTTRNVAGTYDGAFLTGLASSSLSFLNGDAYRTTASQERYLFRSLAPGSRLNRHLPGSIGFGVEDRMRMQANLQFTWSRPVSQVGQNITAARAGLTLGPPLPWTVSGQYVDPRLSGAVDSLYRTSAEAITGFRASHLLPSQFLFSTGMGPGYNYPYFSVNFKDSGKGER